MNRCQDCGEPIRATSVDPMGTDRVCRPCLGVQAARQVRRVLDHQVAAEPADPVTRKQKESKP